MNPDNRQRLLIVATLAVAALFIGDRLVYSPMAQWWQARELEIRKLRTQVTEGRALVKREQTVRARWDDMRTNTLPNNPSLAQERVLKAFQEWAQDSGVSLNAVTPQWRNDSDDYRTLECRIDASGTLGMLSRFIYEVEKGPMGLKLESADFNARDNSGQQLSLGLQVSALVLTSQGK